jgi:Mg/Co/Ni transporter MgtE
MPTQHLVNMLRATPPQRAVGVLLAMPRDRIDRLLSAMDGRLLARMLIAADPDRRASLLNHLDDARLAAELALLPMAEAAAVMAALPPERATAQLDRVSSEHLALLLDAMPGPQRRRLVEAMDPLRLADLRRVGFEKSVIESLRRTSVNLSWVPDDYGSNLFAGVMHRLFGISLCYVDAGEMPPAAVVAAQRAFAQQQVHGVLVVTNVPPSLEAVTLVRDALFAGLPALVVSWDPEDNDGVLARALVRLAG